MAFLGREEGKIGIRGEYGNGGKRLRLGHGGVVVVRVLNLHERAEGERPHTLLERENHWDF